MESDFFLLVNELTLNLVELSASFDLASECVF